jgi:hypothetical protein
MVKDNFSLIDQKLESLSKEESSRLQRSLVSRLQGPMTPNVSLQVVRFPRKLYQKRLLAIYSWYLGDFGLLVRLELEQDRDLLVKLACSSKTAAIEILMSNYSERDFFGNVVPSLRTITSRLKIILKEPRRPKKTIRRRGYRDHGSQKPESKKHRNEPDYELTQNQLLIDQKRKSLTDTYLFIRGFLE